MSRSNKILWGNSAGLAPPPGGSKCNHSFESKALSEEYFPVNGPAVRFSTCCEMVFKNMSLRTLRGETVRGTMSPEFCSLFCQNCTKTIINYPFSFKM